jgi:hypothetical protein
MVQGRQRVPVQSKTVSYDLPAYRKHSEEQGRSMDGTVDSSWQRGQRMSISDLSLMPSWQSIEITGLHSRSRRIS